VALQLAVGAVGLRPPGRRDARAWVEVRLRAQDSFEPWEVLTPQARTVGWGQRQTPGAWHALRRQVRGGQGWAAVITVEGAFAGLVEVSNLVRGASDRGELGYWIDPRLHGQGVGTAAVAMACEHAFAELALHRLEAYVQPSNVASRRLLSSSGFRLEGLARGALWAGGPVGGWADHEVHALLAGDLAGGPVAAWRSRHAPGGSPAPA
jgi:ribosomal-protein-alanine N-acetyltransferase